MTQGSLSLNYIIQYCAHYYAFSLEKNILVEFDSLNANISFDQAIMSPNS